MLDEVIGISGSLGNKIIFSNVVLYPDIPTTIEMKKAPDEAYAVFLSDIHFGSKDFLHEEFDKFTKWISGEVGSEKQKETAKKVKYVFIVGDMVDGIGIYPGQDEELTIKSQSR